MSRRGILVRMMFLLAAAMATEAPWATYANARFGYSICYPPAVLRPQPEADNGDGRKFIGSDGAELLVFGQWNANESSLAKWAKDEAEAYVGKRARITYRAARQNWLVLSGDRGDRTMFYTKTLVRGDEFVSLQIKYPKSQAERYRAIVERLSKCLMLMRPYP